MNTRLYTVDEAISNLVLLEPHFQGLAKSKNLPWCMDCITKHCYALRGLSTEGVKFFPENQDPWRNLGDWCVRVLDMGDSVQEHAKQLVAEVERFRKEDFVPIARQEREQATTTEADFTVVCAWCGKIMKEGGELISHGICESCNEQMHEQLLALESLKKPQQESTVQKESESIKSPSLQILASLPHAEGSPGHVIDEETAKATACTRIQCGSSESVFSPGIIGELAPDQQKTYCPFFTDPKTSPDAEDKMNRFGQAAQTCRVEVAHIKGLAKIPSYTFCMQNELKGE